ncbi:MAG: anthranilate synthase component I family protein [Ferruginibacter sp.]
MKKKTAQFPISDREAFKIKMLNWSCQFNIFCFLDNNSYSFEDTSFECILAAGAANSVSLDEVNIFDRLKNFSDKNPGWLFGHFNYPTAKEHAFKEKDSIGFAEGFFFIPGIILLLKGNELTIESNNLDPHEIFIAVDEQPAFIKKKKPTNVDIKNRYSKNEYLSIIDSLRKHIQRGDCYEINFCQDFYSDNAIADPLFLYHELTSLSPNPFAAFYKLNDKYCMCASPERFLKRSGNKLISQPIKGTSKRDLINIDIDVANKNHLLNSTKEKSENVMIVDLVRNDMSRICTEGSVFVKELFGIYSFPQVHQMISTIEGEVVDDMHWCDIIEACFPMGSMTGAPKIKVMELITKYEIVPRGLFSGTIGYIKPNGDFDFNVVIRSLFYNETKKTISFKAGGGITFYSNAEDEYQESLVKASAIIKVLAES